MPKLKKMWEVWCGSCDVKVHLDIETVHSTDQGAMFYKVPKYECGKCFSSCIVKLVEVEEGV